MVDGVLKHYIKYLFASFAGIYLLHYHSLLRRSFFFMWVWTLSTLINGRLQKLGGYQLTALLADLISSSFVKFCAHTKWSKFDSETFDQCKSLVSLISPSFELSLFIFPSSSCMPIISHLLRSTCS